MKAANKYSIKKRNDGRYEAKVVINGKRKSIYGNSEAQVKRNLKDLKDRIEHNDFTVFGDNIRLGTGIERYLKTMKKEKHQLEQSHQQLHLPVIFFLR